MGARHPVCQCFFPGRCVRAEAATDLTAFGVPWLLSSFPAFDATDLDVFSLCAMAITTPSPARARHTSPVSVSRWRMQGKERRNPRGVSQKLRWPIRPW